MIQYIVRGVVLVLTAIVDMATRRKEEKLKLCKTATLRLLFLFLYQCWVYGKKPDLFV